MHSQVTKKRNTKKRQNQSTLYSSMDFSLIVLEPIDPPPLTIRRHKTLEN